MEGYYQGPPVMAPPQYAAPPPPRQERSFLEGWYVFSFLFHHCNNKYLQSVKTICYQIIKKKLKEINDT